MTDPLAPLRVLRINPRCIDPAIDEAGCTVEVFRRYIETRDASVVPLHEGAVPTWFTVKRLPASYLIEVLEPLPLAAQQLLAFRAACHTVEAEGEVLSVHPSEGAPPKTRWVASPASRGVELAPDAWVQEIADRYGADTVREIGQVACDHAHLPFVRRGGFRWWVG
jgi:hypothetical protein